MVIKQVVLKPGEVLQPQYHDKRAEYLGIVSGQGELAFGDMTSILLPSNCVFVPPRQLHSVKNIGLEDLVFYEVQVGVCEESDNGGS